jgi:glutathione S-transferase
MVKVDLYGDIRSTCTQRVLILLEELNLKYDMNHIDLEKNEQKTLEFLKLQPFGKIPALKYDDRIVFESRSILRYISRNNVDIKDLYGGTDVDIWLEVESQNFYPCASKIIYEKLFKKWKGEKCDTSVVDENLEQLKRVLDVYDNRLSDFSYIAGNDFTIADISHIPCINYLLKCGYKQLFKKYDNVYRWIKQIVKRESVTYISNEEFEKTVKYNFFDVKSKDEETKSEQVSQSEEVSRSEQVSQSEDYDTPYHMLRYKTKSDNSSKKNKKETKSKIDMETFDRKKDTYQKFLKQWDKEVENKRKKKDKNFPEVKQSIKLNL